MQAGCDSKVGEMKGGARRSARAGSQQESALPFEGSHTRQMRPFQYPGRWPTPTQTVTQIGNLLYRGLAVRRCTNTPADLGGSDDLPNAIRRHSRLSICVTNWIDQRISWYLGLHIRTVFFSFFRVRSAARAERRAPPSHCSGSYLPLSHPSNHTQAGRIV